MSESEMNADRHYWETLKLAYQTAIGRGYSHAEFWSDVYYAARSSEDSVRKIACQHVHNAVHQAVTVVHPDADAAAERRRVIEGWDRDFMLTVRHAVSNLGVLKAYKVSEQEGYEAVERLTDHIEGLLHAD